ncbi:MAG: hypothetical protein H7211_11830 [Aquabacterium sp.]|nr:hypothetical protein [Ferruginibacter sp.]
MKVLKRYVVAFSKMAKVTSKFIINTLTVCIYLRNRVHKILKKYGLGGHQNSDPFTGLYFYCTNKEAAMGIIVVSLTFTAQLCGALIAL